MDFGERNSPCQLSVRSADKSRCVIAARVVPANEGTAAWAGGRRGTAARAPSPRATRFPCQPPAPAQQVRWRPRLGALCPQSPSLPPTAGSFWGAAATPGPLAGAVDAFGSFSTPPRGQKQSFTLEIQLYRCSFGFGAGWETKKEDKAFPNWPRVWDGLLLSSSFGLINTQIPLQVWNESPFSTSSTPLKIQPHTVFFSKSVTKRGLESRNTVLA